MLQVFLKYFDFTRNSQKIPKDLKYSLTPFEQAKFRVLENWFTKQLLDDFLLDDLVDPFNTSVLGDSTAEAVVRYRADESVFRVCLVAVYDVPYNYLICVDKTHA